ncbi:hypothetical protein [Candidatus Korobacter versatilis]|uniref:hypothetical protein n=1 Tax=Candidatus Korobacter versatilis TaxID=658062 RepID=UPI000305D970|nr:hypothetical protein [Candidatus Koribacter versatilis]
MSVIAGLAETEMLSRFLHDLSQPVTSLQCSADVALLRPRTGDEYAAVLREHCVLAADLRKLIDDYRSIAFGDGECGNIGLSSDRQECPQTSPIL